MNKKSTVRHIESLSPVHSDRPPDTARRDRFETSRCYEPLSGRPHRELGMSLCEIVVCLVIIAILAVITLGLVNDKIEKAKLAQCFVNIRSIQSKVWSLSDGTEWPEPATFWDFAWAGKKPGPYYYFANTSDANRGHGNDWDFCDEENPGKSAQNRECKDIRFVILCQHHHHNLANYVYIEDEGPPTLAGWGRETNPGYDQLIGSRGAKGKDKG
jgi:hypothetical protein